MEFSNKSGELCSKFQCKVEFVGNELCIRNWNNGPRQLRRSAGYWCTRIVTKLLLHGIKFEEGCWNTRLPTSHTVNQRIQLKPTSTCEYLRYKYSDKRISDTKKIFSFWLRLRLWVTQTNGKVRWKHLMETKSKQIVKS